MKRPCNEGEVEWDTARLDSAARHVENKACFYKFSKLLSDFISLKDRFVSIELLHGSNVHNGLRNVIVKMLSDEINKRLPCHYNGSDYDIPKFDHGMENVVIAMRYSSQLGIDEISRFFEWLNCELEDRKKSLKKQIENLKTEYALEYKQKLKKGIKDTIFSYVVEPPNLPRDSNDPNRGEIYKRFWSEREKIFTDGEIDSITDAMFNYAESKWNQSFDDFYFSVCDLLDEYDFSKQELNELEKSKKKMVFFLYSDYCSGYDFSSMKEPELVSIFYWIKRILNGMKKNR